MNWTKTKLTRWTSGDFKITEDPDSSDGAFRLDSLADFSEWFGTLREAQRAAALKNELALSRAENERLRAELAQARGEWPTAPAQVPVVAAIAGKLQVMDRSAAPAPRGVFRRIDLDGNGNGHGAEPDDGTDGTDGTADGSEFPF